MWADSRRRGDCVAADFLLDDSVVKVEQEDETEITSGHDSTWSNRQIDSWTDIQTDNC